MPCIKSVKQNICRGLRCEFSRFNWKCVIIGAVIILLCGFLSAFVTGSMLSYRELVKPPLAPPAIVFPIVWTVLYALIGGSAGAVACTCDRANEADKYKGLLFFVIMMVFNFIWSPLFFGAEAYFAALCAIIVMIVLTVFIIIFFGRIYKTTAIAMSIYLLWLLFAAYLNLAIIILN